MNPNIANNSQERESQFTITEEMIDEQRRIEDAELNSRAADVLIEKGLELDAKNELFILPDGKTIPMEYLLEKERNTIQKKEKLFFYKHRGEIRDLFKLPEQQSVLTPEAMSDKGVYEMMDGDGSMQDKLVSLYLPRSSKLFKRWQTPNGRVCWQRRGDIRGVEWSAYGGTLTKEYKKEIDERDKIKYEFDRDRNGELVLVGSEREAFLRHDYPKVTEIISAMRVDPELPIASITYKKYEFSDIITVPYGHDCADETILNAYALRDGSKIFMKKSEAMEAAKRKEDTENFRRKIKGILGW